MRIMRLCHNHVTEYEVISNLRSFCFSKHHHHPHRSWEGTAHLVVLKNQAKLLLPCSLPCKPFQSTGCLSSTCFLSTWFSQVSLPFFSWFFYHLPLWYLLNLQNQAITRIKLLLLCLLRWTVLLRHTKAVVFYLLAPHSKVSVALRPQQFITPPHYYLPS